MLKAARSLVRRMGFVGALLLTLAFAMPAFASHACADERSPPAAEAWADAPAQDVQCPDCGPTCANGCCHAPHGATAPDSVVSSKAVAFGAPAAWAHVTGRPLDSPAGPDRPPRA
jgi:hypothetical protein